ncbi:MAG: LysM peptidoglycan-binding domain-containing protein [Arenicellales bacterium]|nr:LysM peptidoglycan-binding domain-containing protein [Arenicellales bacterium]
MNAKPIRTLFALMAIAAVATGCVTAKPTETEAGEATAASPAPAAVMAPAVVAAVAKPDDWCTRYPDSFECVDAAATSEDWCTRHPDSFVCVEEAPVPGVSAYVVQAGDHLWGIASQPKVYSDPYQWPLLFKRNRSEISDADLIYPGQMIQIERDLSDSQVQEAIMHARTRGAWTLGVTEATDLVYLQAAGLSDAQNATAEQAAQMIAQAKTDADAAKAASSVWRLLDSATGGSAVPLTKMIKAAEASLEAGDNAEAYRLAHRVSEAARLGIEQSISQANAGPYY